MKTTKLTLLVLVVLTTVFTSCKKKKEELPAPPDNVKSFTFTTTNSAWVLNGKDYNAIFTLEEIDGSVLSAGSVVVYRGDGTGSVWAAMPVTVENVQYSYAVSLHTVKVIVSANDSNAQNSPGIQQFRVVVTKE